MVMARINVFLVVNLILYKVVLVPTKPVPLAYNLANCCDSAHVQAKLVGILLITNYPPEFCL